MAALVAPGAPSTAVETAPVLSSPTINAIVDACKAFIASLFDGATSVQVVIGGRWYTDKEQALGAIEECRTLSEHEVHRILHALIRHIPLPT